MDNESFIKLYLFEKQTNINKICGIYLITLLNGKRYIGQSTDIYNRVCQQNKYHWRNRVMSHKVLILCMKEDLNYYERKLIHLLNPELNSIRYENSR